MSRWSLDGLSQLLLGVSVDKDCTISDWESVPLSNPQIRYAAVDGLVVLVVHDILQNLHENGGCSSKVVTWNVDVNGRAQRKKVCGKLGSLVHCIGNVDDEDAEDEDADVAGPKRDFALQVLENHGIQVRRSRSRLVQE